MNKKLLSWIIIGVFFVIAAGFILFSSGISQTVFGSYSSYDSCKSNVINNLCNEGYKCFDCKMRSDNLGFGADCSLNPSSSQASNDICTVSSNIISHSRYSCSSGSVYWFDSSSKREDIRSSCSNGCTDTSLKTASCKSVSATNLYGSSACKSLYNLNCPSGCYVDAKTCADGSSGTILNLYGSSACKSLYNLNCPSGCYVDAKTCADGSSGGVVSSVTPDVVSACSTISCNDYIDSDGTSYSQGSCIVKGDTGFCSYALVQTAVVSVQGDTITTCPFGYSLNANSQCEMQGVIVAPVEVDSTCPSTSPIVDSSCGSNMVWKKGSMINGCQTFSCSSMGANYNLFYIILGVLVLGGIIFYSSGKGRKK